MTATALVTIIVMTSGVFMAGLLVLVGFLILEALKEFRRDLRYFYPLLQRERVFDEAGNGETGGYDLEVKVPTDWEWFAEKKEKEDEE